VFIFSKIAVQYILFFFFKVITFLFIIIFYMGFSNYQVMCIKQIYIIWIHDKVRFFINFKRKTFISRNNGCVLVLLSIPPPIAYFHIPELILKVDVFWRFCTSWFPYGGQNGSCSTQQQRQGHIIWLLVIYIFEACTIRG
jgi:hypothetical protein